MNVYEYVIAHHVADLQTARNTRLLNHREEYFLVTSKPLMDKINLREAQHDQTAPKFSARPRD